MWTLTLFEIRNDNLQVTVSNKQCAAVVIYTYLKNYNVIKSLIVPTNISLLNM